MNFRTLRNVMYRAGRALSKAASIMSDIDTYTSGDPKRIGRRLYNKAMYRLSYRVTNRLTKKK